MAARLALAAMLFASPAFATEDEPRIDWLGPVHRPPHEARRDEKRVEPAPRSPQPAARSPQPEAEADATPAAARP